VGIDSCGLVMACTLLALKFHKMVAEAIPALGPRGRHRRVGPVPDHRCKDFLGRASPAHRLAVAVLRLPFPGHHFRRMDLDALAGEAGVSRAP
jgi:hypothetical protein